MTKIGLEIHCQLTELESKLFCSCKANYRGLEPNSNICPICVGLPGSLPRLNKNGIEKNSLHGGGIAQTHRQKPDLKQTQITLSP